MQQTLEKEAEPGVGLHVVGLSVNDTISVLLKAGLARKADRVRADFKVPDRRCVPSETDPLRAVASLTLEPLSLSSPSRRPHQLLLCQAPSAHRDQGLALARGLCQGAQEPDRLRAVCDPPRRQGPPARGGQVRAALRRQESRGTSALPTILATSRTAADALFLSIIRRTSSSSAVTGARRHSSARSATTKPGSSASGVVARSLSEVRTDPPGCILPRSGNSGARRRRRSSSARSRPSSAPLAGERGRLVSDGALRQPAAALRSSLMTAFSAGGPVFG